MVYVVCVVWPFHASKTLGFVLGGAVALGVAIQNTIRMVKTGDAFRPVNKPDPGNDAPEAIE